MLLSNRKISSWKPEKGKGKRKTAVYLRASQGKGTKLASQWGILKPFIEELEDAGYIKKFNHHIKGKSWTRKWQGVKLDGQGDVWNEGIKSGFSLKDRPVLAELLEQVKAGKYDSIVVLDLERLGRNFMDLAYVIREPVVEDGAEMYSFKEDQLIYDDWDFLERLGIILGIEVGGEKKRGETVSAKKTAATKRKIGFAAGTMPAIGQKRKSTGERRLAEPWRAIWLRMKSEEAQGMVHKDSTIEAPRLSSKVTGKIAFDFGKRKQYDPSKKGFDQGNNAWTKKFYKRFKQMEHLGVLDDYLDVLEELTKLSLKAKGDNQVNDLYKLFQHVSGWVLYPAGVFFEDTDKNGKLLGTGVVVKYPNPKGLIKKLHKVADPTVLDGYEISIEEVEKEPDDYLSIQLTESSTRK